MTTKSGLFSATAFCTSITLVLTVQTSSTELAARHYKNGLPDEVSYFPIGVWQQSPSHAQEYRAIGINLFLGLDQGPTEDQLAELAKQNMPVISEQNDVALKSPNLPIIRGWMQGDEPDNAQPLLSGSWGTCIPAREVVRRSFQIKSRDDTRPVLINFGRGVADPTWSGRGDCTGDLGYYDHAISGADILSSDIYPVVSDVPSEVGRLDLPSRGVVRLRLAAREGQRVWAVVETTHIGSREARVNPVQLQSEVMLALIQGATGLVYFVHEWTGGFREDALFRYPEIVRSVRETNTIIANFAPILNSPTLEGRITTSSSIPTALMLKKKDEAYYLFAGSTSAATGPITFSLRGFSQGRAEVVGSFKVLPIAHGEFQDTFDIGYQTRIYRIVEIQHVP